MAMLQEDTIWANWRCFIACSIVVLAPFQYGLDIGMIGGFQAMPGFLMIYGYRDPHTSIGWNILTVRQQLITSLMALGAFLGSSMAGFMAAKFGRKLCLWIASVICAVGNIIMMTTTGLGWLYAGRLILGVSNGYFMTFSQLYIQESSPARYRGLVVSSFQFFISFGTLIGTIVDWKTAGRMDRSAYLIPLGVIFVMPLILSLGIIFVPESPRWLILRGRIEDGRKSLTWLRPRGFDVDVEVSEIQNAIEEERQIAKGAALLETVRHPVDRRRTAISLGAMATHGATGSVYLMSYKAYFFAMAGIQQNPFAMSNVLSAVGLFAIIANLLLVVRFGRRRVMFIIGLLGCGISELGMAIVYDKHPGTKLAGRTIVALACTQLLFYQGFVAPTAWLVSGEIPTQRLRSYTYGFSSAVGFLLSWLVSFTAPYFINPSALNWGPRYGYIWLPSCVIAAVWVYFFVPEVHGRKLEEIDHMFWKGLPARKFRKYVIPGEEFNKVGSNDKAESIRVEEIKE